MGTSLSHEMVSHIKDVYVRLGHRALLNRCRKAKTQNRNDTIHGEGWAKCPKTGFAGLPRVVSAICAAVAEFNERIEATVERTFASGAQRRSSALKADKLRQAEHKTGAQER